MSRDARSTFSRSAVRPRIAVIADSPDENWRSMELVAEMLVHEWQTDFSPAVDVEKIELPLPRIARDHLAHTRAFAVDRLLGRFVKYPAEMATRRSEFDFFHVADHSYAQVVHALPRNRTGVYCHDLDAFRSVLEPAHNPRSVAFRAMTQVLLFGMRRAALVFHSTREMGRRLASIVEPSRLVYAPYGISSEFNADHDPNDGADAVLASLRGGPFVLHVGSAIARKRIDVLFEVFARLHAAMPELRLVQQGGSFSEAQRDHARRLGIESLILQPPKLSREAMAGLYRRAGVVLLPSDAEGFGLPVLEALACGAQVVASDIPTTREAGGDITTFVKVGDIEAWTAAALEKLSRDDDPLACAARIDQAAKFAWKSHAETILNAYLQLAPNGAS